MIAFPKISRRARDKYHNLEDDMMVKNIFNSGKHKDEVGMKIPSWMITDEMKLTENYRIYAAVFEVDVPTTQAQPIESTQGAHRTTSALRSPNPDVDEGESSAPRKYTVIRLRIPQRRSTRLTPPTPILTTAEADDIILQDTIQLSLAEQKSRDELEAKQNVQKVEEHLIAEEIEKLVEGTENVENVKVDSSTLKQNDTQNDPDTRLEPKSNKESPEVEITAEVQPVNINEEEEELAEDDYELKRKEKGKNVEDSWHTPSPTTIRPPRIHSTLVSSDTKKLQELTVNDPLTSYSTPSSSSPKLKLYATNRLLSLFKPKTGRFKRYKSFFDELQGCYGYLFEHLKTRFMPRKKFNVLAQHLQEIMEESLPKMVDDRVKELTKTNVPVYVAQGLILERQQSQADVAKMIADAIQQEHENLRAEISSQINNAITNHIPSQVDSFVRNYICNRMTYQFGSHSKFERLHVSDTPCRPSAVRPRDQDNPQDDAHPEGGECEPGPSTSSNQEQLDDFDFWTDSYATDDDELPTEKVSQELVNKMSQTVDEAKLRKVKGSSRSEKIVMSLHKSPTVIFPDDDIEERTSRWFITEVIARRANGSIVSITESDYKNLNKNDIEDMYLLIFNGKVDDYAETEQQERKESDETSRNSKVCDATLKRVLEGLKSYNNDVKHGYVTLSLSKEDVEYIQLFEEEIDERLKHRDHMRR
ncbi:hypothetical protein Tco_1197317 [Tanacetum coccineum]